MEALHWRPLLIRTSSTGLRGADRLEPGDFSPRREETHGTGQGCGRRVRQDTTGDGADVSRDGGWRGGVSPLGLAPGGGRGQAVSVRGAECAGAAECAD